MSLGALLLILFFGLLLLRVPIGVALGLAAVLIIYLGQLGLQVVSFNFQAGIAKFPLLAIPFFILAGVVMDKAGIAERIVRLVLALVGRYRAGAALAAVLVGMFWGAVSGSGPATVAALGPILYPLMRRQGYSLGFAAALVAAAAELSIIIPPSIAFIVYATIAGTSVAQQFMAGILPGLLLGLLLMGGAYLVPGGAGPGLGVPGSGGAAALGPLPGGFLGPPYTGHHPGGDLRRRLHAHRGGGRGSFLGAFRGPICVQDTFP